MTTTTSRPSPNWRRDTAKHDVRLRSHERLKLASPPVGKNYVCARRVYQMGPNQGSLRRTPSRSLAKPDAILKVAETDLREVKRLLFRECDRDSLGRKHARILRFELTFRVGWKTHPDTLLTLVLSRFLQVMEKLTRRAFDIKVEHGRTAQVG